MADQLVAHIGENSPEYVALQLTRIIADCEGKKLSWGSGTPREYVLRTYAQCLMMVSAPGAAEDVMRQYKP